MARLRDRCGITVAPLFLRVMLAAIFVFAGMAKVCQYMDVSGETAAILANMGVITPAAGVPETKPPETKAPAEPKAPESKPGGGAMRGGTSPTIVAVRQAAGKVYTAADFPTPVKVRMVHMLALGICSAAHPGNDAGGKPKMALWPEKLAEGQWPVYLAWAVALTELVGGIGVLLGFLTRLWSLGLAGVMLGALWLTQIGPAVQSGDTILGFLPNYPMGFDPEKRWMDVFLQFSLLCSALALAFIGPGRLSLDCVLLPGGDKDDDAD